MWSVKMINLTEARQYVKEEIYTHIDNFFNDVLSYETQGEHCDNYSFLLNIDNKLIEMSFDIDYFINDDWEIENKKIVNFSVGRFDQKFDIIESICNEIKNEIN